MRRERRLDAIQRKLDGHEPRPEPPADRTALEGDLLGFVREAWKLLEPTRSFVTNWHHELLAEYLTAVSRRQILRLILNVPPRFTKSRLASVLWPCWSWAQWPACAWIFGSYVDRLASRLSIDRRTVLSSEWFQDRWGDRVEFAADQNLKTEFENTARGTMVATSTGGTVMGFGGDTIVIDDPHNPEQVLSDAERATASRWFDQQIFTRLNDPATGAIVLIQQRLHEQDLTGHLLEEAGEWTHVALPVESEGPTRVVFPVSGRVVERAADELLWPARHTADVIRKKKKQLGTWAFAGQYQQRPVPLGGGIFKRDWFERVWRSAAPTPPFEELVASWDCAFKDLKDSDFVVGQLWGRHGADFYLLDQVRDRMSFTATCAEIARLQGGPWKGASAVLVEDKANGPAVIDTLKTRVSGLIAIEPEGGKVARAYAVSPLVEAGNVVIPADAPWINDWLHEVTSFPAAAHDDQVDCMTQALHRMKTVGASAATWTEFMRTHDVHGMPYRSAVEHPAAVIEDLGEAPADSTVVIEDLSGS